MWDIICEIVCMSEWKPLFYSPLNWLRDHTSWALVELEWRLKVFPSASDLCFEFTTSRYAFLFLNSEIYIVYVINYEWSRSISTAYVSYEIQTMFFQHISSSIMGGSTCAANSCHLWAYSQKDSPFFFTILWRTVQSRAISVLNR